MCKTFDKAQSLVFLIMAIYESIAKRSNEQFKKSYMVRKIISFYTFLHMQNYKHPKSTTDLERLLVKVNLFHDHLLP